MSVSNAPSNYGDGSTRPPSLAKAQHLLEEALELIDEDASHPGLAARLQEVIDALKTPSG
jgi:hypothetical protein